MKMIRLSGLLAVNVDCVTMLRVDFGRTGFDIGNQAYDGHIVNMYHNLGEDNDQVVENPYPLATFKNREDAYLYLERFASLIADGVLNMNDLSIPESVVTADAEEGRRDS